MNLNSGLALTFLISQVRVLEEEFRMPGFEKIEKNAALRRGVG